MKLFNIEVSIPEGKMQADCIDLLEKSAAYLQCVMAGCDVFLKEVDGAEPEKEEPDYYILVTGVMKNGNPFANTFTSESEALLHYNLEFIVGWEWLEEELKAEPFFKLDAAEHDHINGGFKSYQFMRLVMA